ncbi:unnamed protein product [Chrysoparadoxa australica]
MNKGIPRQANAFATCDSTVCSSLSCSPTHDGALPRKGLYPHATACKALHTTTACHLLTTMGAVAVLALLLPALAPNICWPFLLKRLARDVNDDIH